MWKIHIPQIKEEIYSLLIRRGLFPEEQKECCKWTRDIGELLCIDPYILRESKTRRKKTSYGIDWLQKGMSAELDNKQSQNVQDIRRSHKLYRENHWNLESGVDSRKKRLNWGENPESDLAGRCAITITFCNSDDATQSHTQEMHRQIKT